ALAWPDRMPTPCARLNLAEIAKLTFEEPDPVRFPALRLAREALRAGGAAPTILNAANEIAVSAFLGGHIGFLDIAAICESALTKINSGGRPPLDLDEIYEIDRIARIHTEELVHLASR